MASSSAEEEEQVSTSENESNSESTVELLPRVPSYPNWRAAIDARAMCQDATVDDDDGPPSLPPIARLPALASDYFKNYQERPPGWTPKIKLLLAGVCDKDSPLNHLCGFENSIIRKICSYFAHEYVPNVKLTLPGKNIGNIFGALYRFETRQEYYGDFSEAEDLNTKTDLVSFTSCGRIDFPPLLDNNVHHNINMMPFIMGKKESLPENLRRWYSCIQRCPIGPEENGKVCYLTVHESFVQAQTSQRREGLHIEAPGVPGLSSSSFVPGREHHWGGGHFNSPDVYKGGIYFASSVANTSVVYNALVDKTIPGIVDSHGNCEHLRKFIGPGTMLDAGQLVWMTDRTPHEAIPQERDGYRQFFRVVTSQISFWFAQHSTPNPNVALPDHVTVVHENKFDTVG